MPGLERLDPEITTLAASKLNGGVKRGDGEDTTGAKRARGCGSRREGKSSI
jgi:hypothetical protein